METYSTDTSPRSDTPVIPPPPPKVKLLYSYGGRIQTRPLDHRLTYVGGHTKILTIDRSVSYSSLLTKFSSLCDITEHANLAIKYQLPGEDLDALVSIVDDDDLDHMMVEYDRLCSINPAKTARLRLFLFPSGSCNKLSSLSTSDSGGSSSKSSNSWFAHAFNYASETKPVNPDYLFGFDKNISGVSGPEPNPSANAQISGEIYPPTVQEKPTSPEIPAAIPLPGNFPAIQVPVSGGGYEMANSVTASNAPVYYIPPLGGGYVAAGFHPVTAHVEQGFYGVQKVGAEPVAYNMAVQQLLQPNMAVGGAGLGHVGCDAAGRQVFSAVPQGYQAVAVEGRQGGGAMGLEGNVPNMAPQSQTSTA